MVRHYFRWRLSFGTWDRGADLEQGGVFRVGKGTSTGEKREGNIVMPPGFFLSLVLSLEPKPYTHTGRV